MAVYMFNKLQHEAYYVSNKIFKTSLRSSPNSHLIYKLSEFVDINIITARYNYKKSNNPTLGLLKVKLVRCGGC